MGKFNDVMVADWIFIDSENCPFYQVVKEEDNLEQVGKLNQLEIVANVLNKEGHREVHSYLYNDRIFVQEGVFSWSYSEKRYNKLDDTYNEISNGTFDFINYDRLLATINKVLNSVLEGDDNLIGIELYSDFIHLAFKDVNANIDGMKIATFLIDELYNRNIDLDKSNIGFYYPDGNAISIQIHDHSKISKHLIEYMSRTNIDSVPKSEHEEKVWYMVHGQDGDTYQGVNNNENGQKLMSLSELQEMANDVIELGDRNHPAYKYLFNDHLEIQKGIFKWIEELKRFHKVLPKLSNVDTKSLLEKTAKEMEYQRYESLRRATRPPEFPNK